jgi:hypothetical protein
MPRKLAGLSKTYLNGTYSTLRVGKCLFDKFPVQYALKYGEFYH